MIWLAMAQSDDPSPGQPPDQVHRDGEPPSPPRGLSMSHIFGWTPAADSETSPLRKGEGRMCDYPPTVSS
jgi:hypothetical protein